MADGQTVTVFLSKIKLLRVMTISSFFWQFDFEKIIAFKTNYMRKLFLLLFTVSFCTLCFSQTDSTEIKLQKFKDMYFKGLISEQEYDKLRKKTLGIDEPTTTPQVQKEVVVIRQKS